MRSPRMDFKLFSFGAKDLSHRYNATADELDPHFYDLLRPRRGC